MLLVVAPHDPLQNSSSLHCGYFTNFISLYEGPQDGKGYVAFWIPPCNGAREGTARVASLIRPYGGTLQRWGYNGRAYEPILLSLCYGPEIVVVMSHFDPQQQGLCSHFDFPTLRILRKKSLCINFDSPTLGRKRARVM